MVEHGQIFWVSVLQIRGPSRESFLTICLKVVLFHGCRLELLQNRAVRRVQPFEVIHIFNMDCGIPRWIQQEPHVHCPKVQFVSNKMKDMLLRLLQFFKQENQELLLNWITYIITKKLNFQIKVRTALTFAFTMVELTTTDAARTLSEKRA